MTYGGSLFAAYYAQHASRLPAGYREVEWLGRRETQYIDTGVLLDVSSVEIDTEGRINEYVQYAYLFGNYKNESTGVWRVILHSANNGKAFGNCGNKAAPSVEVSSFSLGDWHTIHEEPQKLVVDGAAYTTPAITNYSDVRLALFTGSTSPPTSNRNVDIKFFRLKKGGVLIRDFVPCVRIADSKPGMYDLCGSICGLTNSPFYINSGSGADFTWGELS